MEPESILKVKCESGFSELDLHQKFSGMLKALQENNLEKLKDMEMEVTHIYSTEIVEVISTCWNATCNPLKNTNLVILACKLNNLDALKYLLSNKKSILFHLNPDVSCISLFDMDEDQHNALYYAIRSNNVPLLRILIAEWFEEYPENSQEIENLLSNAFNELMLKNIHLTQDMEYFIVDQLVELHFLCNFDVQYKATNLSDIANRVEFLLQNINILTDVYKSSADIDDKFIFIAKFIAKNIHILKRQVKSTYLQLPWEEMEFYMIIFILYYNKNEPNNFYYQILSRDKLLNYLKHFSSILQNVLLNIKKEDITIQVLNLKPKLKRDEVVSGILNASSAFEELYKDFTYIRDVYSLHKMTDIISIALDGKPGEQETKIIISRALQVVGELFKNTLDSPKLSSSISTALLSKTQSNTLEVITSVRDSLSHADSLFLRTQIEEKSNTFFFNIQNDLKKIKNAISDILLNVKKSLIQEQLHKLISKDDSMKHVLDVNQNVAWDINVLEKFEVSEHQTIVESLHEIETELETDYEIAVVKRLLEIMDIGKENSKNVLSHYTPLSMFKSGFLLHSYVSSNIDFARKAVANNAKRLSKDNEKLCNENDVNQLLLNLLSYYEERSDCNDTRAKKVRKSLYRIRSLLELGMNINSVEYLRDQLVEKKSKSKKRNYVTPKLDNDLSIQLFNEKLSCLKLYINAIMENNISNRNTLTVVEMLLLDIMSLLPMMPTVDEKTIFAEDQFCLDRSLPVLTGKSLRNHLAHDNTIVRLQSVNVSIAVLCNSKRFIQTVISKHLRLGRIVNYSRVEIEESVKKNLHLIDVQQEMFSAIKNGDIDSLKNWIKRGADINARNNMLQTVVHFAAKSNLECAKYIVHFQEIHINSKDINCQSPLHIAAQYGDENIVQLFLDLGASIDDTDNFSKTALHLAAHNGHKNVIEILLKVDANIFAEDVYNLMPICYAVVNDYIDIVKILFWFAVKKDIIKVKEIFFKNFDVKLLNGGLTLVDLAAINGHLLVLEFLLQNMPTNEEIQCKHICSSALYNVARYNQRDTKIIHLLIMKGAYFGFCNSEGCSLLRSSVVANNCELTKVALDMGANPNETHPVTGASLLALALANGSTECLNILMSYKCSVNAAFARGTTALHVAAFYGNSEFINNCLIKYDSVVDVQTIDGNTPLHMATAGESIEVVKLLLHHGANANCATVDKITPLHLAVQRGNMEIIKILIQNKADIYAFSQMGLAPLHLATYYGNVDVINYLIKQNINIIQSGSISPLHISAFKNDNFVEFWLNNGIDVNIQDPSSGFTPLHYGAENGNVQVCKKLLESGAEIDRTSNDGRSALFLAVLNNHYLVSKLLVENGANVNVYQNNIFNPLQAAIYKENNEITKLLLGHGAEVHPGHLRTAVRKGNKKLLQLFLNRKNFDLDISLDDRNHTMLCIAAQKGERVIVELLIEKGANCNVINNDGFTPLMLAAACGHADVIEVLLKKNVNLNNKSKKGQSAIGCALTGEHCEALAVLLANESTFAIESNIELLERAVIKGNLDLVKIILNQKEVSKGDLQRMFEVVHKIANTSGCLEIIKYTAQQEISHFGESKFSFSDAVEAVLLGHYKLVKYYTENGVCVTEIAESGMSLLHYSVLGNNNNKVIEYLVNQRIDVNLQDPKGGMAALHTACFHGNKEIVETLLQNGAIYDVTTKFNLKPCDITRNVDILKLLIYTRFLFKELDLNNSSDIEYLIREGACVNARAIDGQTPLHAAILSNNINTLRILLNFNANPRQFDSFGKTPLFYAIKQGNFDAVKELFMHGATFEPSSMTYCTSRDISALLELINGIFESAINCESTFLETIRLIDKGTLKVIMNSRNKDNKNIFMISVENNFFHNLLKVFLANIELSISEAKLALKHRNYALALNLYNLILEKVCDVVGSTNPAALYLRSKLSKILLMQSKLQDSLELSQIIYKKLKVQFAKHNNLTLSFRNHIASALLKNYRNVLALSICTKISEDKMIALGISEHIIMKIKLNEALALGQQKKYDKSLLICLEVFNSAVENSCNPKNSSASAALYQIMEIYFHKRMFHEALELIEKLYEQYKLNLEPNDPKIMQLLYKKACIYLKIKKVNEAFNLHKFILDIQERFLESDNIDLLKIRYNIALCLFTFNAPTQAMGICIDVLDKMRMSLHPDHSLILRTEAIIELFQNKYKLDNKTILRELILSIEAGDVNHMKVFLNESIVNMRDEDGRSLLHHAAKKSNVDVLRVLLENGVNPEIVTYGRKTILHCAIQKENEHMVEAILACVQERKNINFNEFINAKSSNSGNTALHIAAKAGLSQIINILLKSGAIFNPINSFNKTPLEICFRKEDIEFFTFISNIFELARSNNINIFTKLEGILLIKLECIMNTQNNNNETILQVVLNHN